MLRSGPCLCSVSTEEVAMRGLSCCVWWSTLCFRSEDFMLELAVMKALKHANLVQLYAVCTIGTPLFIVTELMANGA